MVRGNRQRSYELAVEFGAWEPAGSSNDSPLAGRELTNAAGVSDHLSVWETSVDSSLDDRGGVHDGSTTA